ncbi:MAG: LamG domain-containing protein [Candidatus Paceibacterota bacterium]|jgi:prepilin-type N-terminal cleavage/methylation domain-containing protein
MNKSFTLIEILVVIVIIGIISAFIIVSMAGVSDKARIAKGQAFSNSLKNSLMLNLVSEWRLDDASGTTAQDHWGANPGTWFGAGGGSYTSPSWRTASECVSGGCLAFDGTDDYVQVPGSNVSTSNLAITGAITLSVWVKFNDAGTYQSIVGRGRPFSGNGNYGYSLARSSNNRAYFITCDTTTVESGTYSLAITNTNWHFVAGTWDGTTNTNGKKIYIDGKLEGQGTSTFSLMGQPSFYFRTGIDGGSWAPLNGFIDDVRIYNAAIPTSQIQQKYYSGLNKLLSRGGFDMTEYEQRLGELKYNLTNNE